MINSYHFFRNRTTPPYPKKKMFEEVAEKAYIAYCVQLEYIDCKGNQLKSWELLSNDAKDAWINAALAVHRHYSI